MNYDLLIDLHKANKRQGPGGAEQTKQSMQLAGLINGTQYLQIGDIGCGTGASTLVLAENLNATIAAVDLFQDFLDVLSGDADKNGVADQIKTLAVSIEELPVSNCKATSETLKACC